MDTILGGISAFLCGLLVGAAIYGPVDGSAIISLMGQTGATVWLLLVAALQAFLAINYLILRAED